MNVPTFQLPAVIARVGGLLPQWPHSVALSGALNLAARFELLPADSLAAMDDRTFLIEVLDTGSRAAFTRRDGAFRPLLAVPAAPDLVFRANLAAYLQLLTRQEDPDTLFFNRTLVVEGDTELGLMVKNTLDAIDWDGLRARLSALLPAGGRLPLFSR